MVKEGGGAATTGGVGGELKGESRVMRILQRLLKDDKSDAANAESLLQVLPSNSFTFTSVQLSFQLALHAVHLRQS